MSKCPLIVEKEAIEDVRKRARSGTESAVAKRIRAIEQVAELPEGAEPASVGPAMSQVRSSSQKERQAPRGVAEQASFVGAGASGTPLRPSHAGAYLTASATLSGTRVCPMV